MAVRKALSGCKAFGPLQISLMLAPYYDNQHKSSNALLKPQYLLSYSKSFDDSPFTGVSITFENMDENIYNDQIFTLSSYFMNNMLSVRPLSSQEKFEIMFINHASSQSFFTKIDKYLKIFSNKITKGVLKKKFRLDDDSSTATDKPYYANEILERQIIECLKGLCSKSNTFMQDYMRSQFKNSRTYNFVDIL